uniref:Ig-like domain-containing protein n=1 Tax=Leptobrachium leishanense TaxID=445787 RepID=A0A8C5PH06_9ANUR
MSWALFLLLFASHHSCSVAQFVVTQEATMSISSDKDVQLSCSRSGGTVTGHNYPSWHYQTPGGVPKIIVYSSSTSNQNAKPSWTTDPFTGTIIGGSAVLSIRRVQIDADGNYYCCLYAGNNIFHSDTS